MKGNLLKKIGAIATTVAMIASVSVTGFAAYETEVEGVKLNGSISVTEWNTATDQPATEKAPTGIYKVDVPYISGVNNTIGITMLSYSAGTSGTDINKKPAYGSDVTGGEKTGMQIVGVDQKNATETNTGINGTDTFTFYVDTNENASDSSAIRMKKGEKGIVLLSGDAANGANGYLFQVGKPSAKVTVVGKGSDDVKELDASGYPAEGQEGKDYVKDIITDYPNGFYVKLIDRVEDESKITVVPAEVDKDYNDEDWKYQSYDYVVKVEDDTVHITGDATITVNYRTKAWGENITATYEHTIYADPTVQTNMDDVTAKVKDELKDKTVTLTDGTYNYNYALTADDIATINTPSGAEWAEGREYSYAMTIKAKTIKVDKKNNLTIPDVTATIHVKSQADTRCEATSAKAFKGSAEVANTATYTMAENDTAQKVLDYAQTLVDSFKLYDGKDNEVAGTATWTLMQGDVEATLEETLVDADVYTAVATVVPAEEDGEDKWKETPRTVEITITVSAKPAYACGDVNHDNAIDTADAIAILDYAVNPTANQYVFDNKTESDARRDDSIDTGDAIAILDSIVGAVTLPVIP